ncbi:MAG: translation initiation factor IF-2 [Thermodesulfovibrionales bacterium]
MAKMRVYELSRKLGKSNKELLSALSGLGITDKTHSSTIDDSIAKRLMEIFDKPKPAVKPAPPAPAEKKHEAAPPAREKAPEKAPRPEAGEKARPSAPPRRPDRRPAPKAPEAARPPKAPEAARPAPPRAPEAARPPKARPEKRKEHRKKEAARRREAPAAPAAALEAAKAPGKEALPEEETELKVPDRFKKDIEAEKVEKFKARPGMRRAFQTIRKIDQKKWGDQRGGFRRGPGGAVRERPGAVKAEKRPLPPITAPRKKTLKIQEGTTVKEFAEIVGAKVPDIIKKFMEMGYMPTINQAVDMDAALLVADSLGVKLEVAPVEDLSAVEEAPEDVSKLVHRPPVVTIMGHVDHGKTSLLDAIRETKVIESEAGGITQHIGAYKVSLKGKEIVFLDTPGHEAFTALRARGAKVTDIVVLIVAADDGVKPQTVEAIDHAKAAGVPIIVAINKIDKPEANVQKVKNELSEHGIVSEEWGGQNIFAEISAKKRVGIENLLELILLQAEVMELKANPEKLAKGAIIESRLDKGRGPVATVLVQSGTLRTGDAFLSGTNAGRVRALLDDTGAKIDEAGPSTPVEVIGFGNVPTAGDSFAAMEDERKARQIALARLQKQRTAEMAKATKLSLDEVYSKIKEGEIKELNIVIKADVQGSVEAMKSALEGITHPEVKVRALHSGIGGINESDVMLAAASQAIIIGFNVRPEAKAWQTAEREGVDIRLYNIIYEAIEDVKKALEGMLEPTLKEKILGRAEVRNTFHVSRLGTIAGCYVTDGTISRASDGARVIRDNIVMHEGKIASLKRFKEDARDVQSGYECGILLENFNDIKVGDVIENFVIEKVAAKI